MDQKRTERLFINAFIVTLITGALLILGISIYGYHTKYAVYYSSCDNIMYYIAITFWLLLQIPLSSLHAVYAFKTAKLAFENINKHKKNANKLNNTCNDNSK